MPSPPASVSLLQAESRLCNGSDKECVSPTARVTKKETLKVGTDPRRGYGCEWAPGPVRPPSPSLPKGGDKPPLATSVPPLPLLALPLSSLPGLDGGGPKGRRSWGLVSPSLLP